MNQIELKSSVVGVVMTDKADQILKALRTSRNNIKVLSDQIADKECGAKAVEDQLKIAQAEAFVKAATATRQDGKLVNPNIDSQKAASEIILKEVDGYDATLDAHRDMLKEIQVKKNTIVCEHERRGDLKTEVELLKLLMAEAI
jgi:hypothetical protein